MQAAITVRFLPLPFDNEKQGLFDRFDEGISGSLICFK